MYIRCGTLQPAAGQPCAECGGVNFEWFTPSKTMAEAGERMTKAHKRHTRGFYELSDTDRRLLQAYHIDPEND